MKAHKCHYEIKGRTSLDEFLTFECKCGKSKLITSSELYKLLTDPKVKAKWL